MALSSEVQRRIYLYFGVAQSTVSRGLGVFATPVVNLLQTALDNLTSAGEANVVDLMTTLDAKWAALAAVGDSLQVRRAGPIELRGDEFDARRQDFNFWLSRLDAILFPPDQSLMGLHGGAGDIQGPSWEP